MSAGISPLHALAAELGISAQFRDTLGNDHTASDATVRALVHATGVEAGSSAEISASLAALKADPLREIPVARSGAVNLPFAGPVHWQVTLEDGAVREGRAESTVRITGLPVGDIEEARAAAEILLAGGVRAAVITLGENGVLFHDATRSEHIPAFNAGPVVETTGAGDAFNGAFAAALAEGQDALDAARFGCACAAISVTRPGTAPSMPARAEIDALLAKG